MFIRRILFNTLTF